MSAHTALLVIDMQIGLVEGAYQEVLVLDRIADLLGRARRAGVPVVHVQHHHATYAPTCRRAISLGLNVTLVSDAHTTIDAAFPAEQIIRHHNTVLPRLAHPSHHITVRPSRDVTFGEGDPG